MNKAAVESFGNAPSGKGENSLSGRKRCNKTLQQK
jgi:hypothetical protein